MTLALTPNPSPSPTPTPTPSPNRLDSWEWRIYNENVTFVSCDEAGTLTYSGRGFNAERHEVAHPGHHRRRANPKPILKP